MSDIADELTLMTNLDPRSTGLPMVIWVGPSCDVAHSPRIKVMQTHGDRMDLTNLAVVAIRPRPYVVTGHLSRDDLDAVSRWLMLNRDAVLDHGNAVIDGAALVQRLRRLP